jgi:hypothetical protein
MKEEITPDTYRKMNEDYEERGENFRIKIPTQQEIDDRPMGTYIDYDYPKPDLIAEMWEEYNKENGK